MAATSLSHLTNVIKTRYPQKKLKEMLYGESQLLGLLAKDEASPAMFGLSVQHSGAPGASATFSAAQARVGTPAFVRFLINSHASEYGVMHVETKSLRVASSELNSLYTDLKSKCNGAIYSGRKAISKAIFGNGGGAFGQISSGSGSTTLQLTQRADIVNCEVGMWVGSSNTDGTSGADDAEYFEISAVDRINGRISKAAGNWNAGGNFAAADYLFRQGDFGAKMKGLAAWLPLTAPGGGDSFWGVNRSVDPERLAGWRATATVADVTLERFFLRVSSDVQVMGGKADTIVMNPIDAAYFLNEVGSRVSLRDEAARDSGAGKDKVTVNYRLATVVGASGPMRVLSDPYCPKGLAYMLTLDVWKLYSLGALFGWLDDGTDGSLFHVYNNDAYEGRVGGYMQFGTDSPGANAVCDISALVVAAA